MFGLEKITGMIGAVKGATEKAVADNAKGRAEIIRLTLSGQGRTLGQVEADIRAETEACMSSKKSDGILNQMFANPEQWRGECESYARRHHAAELGAAQQVEAQNKFAVDDALKRELAGGSNSQNTILIVAAAALIAFVIYLLLS